MKKKKKHAVISSGFDSEGNMIDLTYEVFVRSEDWGLRVHLDAGLSAVQAFWSLANKGIPGALSTEFGFGFNADVEILGKDLRRFLGAHYPEIYERRKNAIRNDKKYLIIGYDLS